MRVSPEIVYQGNLHGGVRGGEDKMGHGGPKRARSWKRRTETKENLPLAAFSSTRRQSTITGGGRMRR